MRYWNYSLPAILKFQKINFVNRWHRRGSGSNCEKSTNGKSINTEGQNIFKES